MGDEIVGVWGVGDMVIVEGTGTGETGIGAGTGGVGKSGGTIGAGLTIDVGIRTGGIRLSAGDFDLRSIR